MSGCAGEGLDLHVHGLDIDMNQFTKNLCATVDSS